MTFQILITVFFLGLALSADAFAAAITSSMQYSDFSKKKGIFIALVFGIFQGFMPLISYYIIELIYFILGETIGDKVTNIFALVIAWCAFAALLIIGTDMIVNGIKEIKKPKEEKISKLFSYKEVLLLGVATSIDALAMGIVLRSNISTNITIWLHISIIIITTFVISLLGAFLGNFFYKLFKGKYEITSIIGGSILILLAVWIITSYYTGI